jgi:DNA-binding response OmpR family regulator
MKVRVLLVDDEEQFVETLALRLEARDFAVATAFKGDQALDYLKGKDVDVVVLDVLMPGLSGIDTLREMKKIRPLTEVIMLTGHATVETGIEGMKMGAFDYLMKPCNTEELVAKVQAAAARKRQHEEKIMEARLKTITLRRP